MCNANIHLPPFACHTHHLVRRPLFPGPKCFICVIYQMNRMYHDTIPNHNTVVNDFNGHDVNGIHGLNGKKCYNKALYSVNNRHDFKGMYDFKGNFLYDDFFRKTHARLYFLLGKSKSAHFNIRQSFRNP